MRPRSLVLGALVLVGAATAVFVAPVRDALGGAADTVSGWATELRDVADAQPATEAEARSLSGDSASLLLIVGDGADVAFALLSAGPDAPPSVTVLPQDLLLAVPGFGEFRLIDAFVFDGPDLAALAVTNQFGVRIDRVASLGSEAWESAFADQLVVELAAAFFIDDGESITRRLPAGVTEVSPGTIELLLTESGGGDIFEWIQRQGAGWKSVLDAVSAEPRAADRLLSASGGGDAADLLVTIAAAEDAVVATIPVERVVSSTGGDALAPVEARVSGFLAERMGHLLLVKGDRARIEILNGNGRIGSTRAIADTLIPRGYRLVRTDNADNFDYAETLVIAQGSRSEGAARDVVDILGRGLLFLELQAPSSVVDVSIIVGSDVPSGEG